MYEECILTVFLMVFRHFLRRVRQYIRSSDIRTEACRFAQKNMQIFPRVLRHWSTCWYWYHRRESYTLRKQASDFTWWPTIDDLLYQWSCRSFGEEEEHKLAVLPIPIADSDWPGPFWRRCDTLWIQDHSRNTVSYPKKP